MDKQNITKYPLPVGAQDNERLKFQSMTLDQVSHPHLDNAGLSSCETVADVGCGNGMMILHFLTKENIKTIYAIDSSQEQLNQTKINVDKWFEENQDKKLRCVVEYVQMDITKEVTQLQNTMDLVFVRFVFCNINNATYNAALAGIKSIMKPGGKFVCEEPVWDNIMCSVHQDKVEEYKKFMHNEYFKLGIDRNVGKYLDTMLTNATYELNYYEVINRQITPKELVIMYNSIMKIKRNAMALDDTMTEEDKIKLYVMFDTWDAAFNSILENDKDVHVQTSGTGCITATKPL
jgi:ubiquinone/menaquinone biosynthesis C-methylase UbiE